MEKQYCIGIDLGGTFVKGGIVQNGKILLSDKIPTKREEGPMSVIKRIAEMTEGMIKSAKISKDQISGIGMGIPGMTDSESGTVICAENIAWYDFPAAKELEALTSLPVRLANDANAAALGEVKYGSGRSFRSAVVVTLGTGVGGGAVIDGALLEGNRGAGAEFGHVCIAAGGEKCSCGRRGCLEAYASATALIRDTKKKMKQAPDSKMWQLARTLDDVDGQTAFRAEQLGDSEAAEVIDRYVTMLSEGLLNIAAVIRPEAILIGGGVSAEGENLTSRLRAYVNEHIFGGDRGPKVEILTASLGNSAGTIGAAELVNM